MCFLLFLNILLTLSSFFLNILGQFWNFTGEKWLFLSLWFLFWRCFSIWSLFFEKVYPFILLKLFSHYFILRELQGAAGERLMWHMRPPSCRLNTPVVNETPNFTALSWKPCLVWFRIVSMNSLTPDPGFPFILEVIVLFIRFFLVKSWVNKTIIHHCGWQ